jgi:hypothetical protein
MSPEQIRAAHLAKLEAENEHAFGFSLKRVTRAVVEPDVTLHELIEKQGRACALANWPWHQRYFTVVLWYRNAPEQAGDYQMTILVPREACTSTSAAIAWIAVCVRKGERWACGFASDIENLLALGLL